MGYPYHELIPAAILFDKPGLTKDEFIKALDETHATQFNVFEADAPWDIHTNTDSEEFHKGEAGLAYVLGLDSPTELELPEDKGRFRFQVNDENFLWLRTKYRHYLDPETFNLIPASWEASGWENYGYADLVLTAEAIKHKAWKLLSRKGLDHLDAFLRDFPDSRRRYEQATLAGHLSLASRKYQETITDLLRMRIEPH